MRDFIVKNTTRINLFDLLCPHFCRGCGRLGRPLCECCKNDIIQSRINYCPACHKPNNGKCKDCELPFDKFFMVGWRDTIIGELVEEYKYQSIKDVSNDLAEILDIVIPRLDGEVVIIPLPTINKHIRERGFDHTKTIARKLARKRGYKVKSVLIRTKNTVQVGSNSEQRKKQAKEAFRLVGEIKENTTYLLLDDIWTTGASMIAAAELIKNSGAEKILGMVVAVSRIKLFAGDGFGGGSGATFDTDGIKHKVDDCERKNSNN